MRSLLFSTCLLILSFWSFPSLSETQGCWTSSVYHESAWILAKSVGPVDSEAVCVFGDDKSLSEECSPPCQALIMAVWGDCYCRNVHYRPSSLGGRVDRKLTGKSVLDIFRLFTNATEVAGITCREWMKEEESLSMVKCRYDDRRRR